MAGAVPYCTVDEVAGGRHCREEAVEFDVEDATDSVDLARVPCALGGPDCPHRFGSVTHGVRILARHGVECRMALGTAGTSAIGQ